MYMPSPSGEGHGNAFQPSQHGGLATHTSLEVSAGVAGAAAWAAAPEAAAALDPEGLLALIRNAVEAVVGNPVGDNQPLMAAGLDSLAATELQQGLADSLGLELPSTLVFDYPTTSAMAEFIGFKLGSGGAADVAQVQASPLMAAHSGGSWAAALVGAAGQQVVLQQHPAGDAVSRVPHARWDVDWPGITGDGTMPAQVRAGGECSPFVGALGSQSCISAPA